ncbi:MAG: Gfo/Idh/MocA family oxidoreductase, partial [Acidimicrobiaceae bacterium]|nr:Gfo/Idh/MocA family oxidoreductase [Acidimicrobiaceae bacterium]
MSAQRRLGVAVLGFGWMGQAHARSYARLPMIFDGLAYRAELTVCADTLESRRATALNDFGFREATGDWRAAVDHPDVDVVAICAPNMVHCEMVEAAAAAGKHVFCEKPVGGTPAQTARAEKACRDAGVITGVGYNYRFVPLVQHARNLIEAGELGEITNYRGRFFSMYGADPLGL